MTYDMILAAVISAVAVPGGPQGFVHTLVRFIRPVRLGGAAAACINRGSKRVRRFFRQPIGI